MARACAVESESGYSLDFLLLPSPTKQTGLGFAFEDLDGTGMGIKSRREGEVVGAEVREHGIVVEVDGPAHFLRPGGRLASGNS